MAKKLTTTGIKYARTYTKKGERAEVLCAYTTDKLVITPDHNTPFYEAGDYRSAVYGEVQVKSARATVCEGYNIKAHIAKDAANTYAYVVDSEEYVILLTPQEWERFLEEWAFEAASSKDGRPIMRLPKETELMRMCLDELVNGRDYSRPYYWTKARG